MAAATRAAPAHRRRCRISAVAPAACAACLLAGLSALLWPVKESFSVLQGSRRRADPEAERLGTTIGQVDDYPYGVVVVDGLSPAVSKQDIVKHFRQIGHVSDVDFSGETEAWVYYLSEEEADEAVRQLDQSVIMDGEGAVDVFRQGSERIKRKDLDGSKRKRQKSPRIVIVSPRSARSFKEQWTSNPAWRRIKEHFEGIAPVQKVYKRSDGRYKVYFFNEEDAIRAAREYDLSVVRGSSDVIRCKVESSDDGHDKLPRVRHRSDYRKFKARQERELDEMSPETARVARTHMENTPRGKETFKQYTAQDAFGSVRRIREPAKPFGGHSVEAVDRKSFQREPS